MRNEKCEKVDPRQTLPENITKVCCDQALFFRSHGNSPLLPESTPSTWTHPGHMPAPRKMRTDKTLLGFAGVHGLRSWVKSLSKENMLARSGGKRKKGEHSPNSVWTLSQLYFHSLL